jgi:hypothetical protein
MERWLMVVSVVCVVVSLLVHLEVILTNRTIIPYGFLLAVLFWGLSAISFVKRGPKSDMSFLFQKKNEDK